MIGRQPPAYEKSVFINCPFDSEYRDLMLAHVFSVSAHGFSPSKRAGDPGRRGASLFQVLHSRPVAFDG